MEKFKLIKVERTSSNTIRVIIEDSEEITFNGICNAEKTQIKRGFQNRCLICGKLIDDRYELCYSCNEDKRLDFSN